MGVIAVSSFRPFGGSPEYDANTLRAWKSWQASFAAVVYFNDPEPQLESPKTRFIPSEKYPRIIDLVEFCAEQHDWCAILNADIVVPCHFQSVERRLKARKAVGASSWRWTFDPNVGISKIWIEPGDNGVDFFAATPDFWKLVYAEVPEVLTINAPRWDSWLLGVFAGRAVQFYDITPSKTVLHPKHEGRAYGPMPPDVHFPFWPVMAAVTLGP